MPTSMLSDKRETWEVVQLVTHELIEGGPWDLGLEEAIARYRAAPAAFDLLLARETAAREAAEAAGAALAAIRRETQQLSITVDVAQRAVLYAALRREPADAA